MPPRRLVKPGSNYLAEEFTRQFRAAIRRRGMTMRAFSRLAKADHSFLCRRLSHQGNPTVKTIVMLLDVLGLRAKLKFYAPKRTAPRQQPRYVIPQYSANTRFGRR